MNRHFKHFAILVSLFSVLSLESYSAAKEEEELVSLASVDATILQDIRYATTHNFMNEVLYPKPICVLRRSVAMALARVQQAARLQNVRLKVWDCYRPSSIQRKMWNRVKDERYVANPDKGGSKHGRGAAVDVTLVSIQTGNDLEMPTDYDDFSVKAHRDYAKSSRKAKQNREQLRRLMAIEGFQPFATEWWHFDAPGWEKYSTLDIPLTDFN